MYFKYVAYEYAHLGSFISVFYIPLEVDYSRMLPAWIGQLPKMEWDNIDKQAFNNGNL